MQQISSKELAQWRTDGKPHQLIDVREPFEANIATIGGELIPLNTVMDNAAKIRKDIDVVVHCRSGKRSADAIRQLQVHGGFQNLYNLEGGILAFSDLVDPSVPKY